MKKRLMPAMLLITGGTLLSAGDSSPKSEYRPPAVVVAPIPGSDTNTSESTASVEVLPAQAANAEQIMPPTQCNPDPFKAPNTNPACNSCQPCRSDQFWSWPLWRGHHRNAGDQSLFCEPQFGDAVRPHLMQQVQAGKMNSLVLYQFDFADNGYAERLSTRGNMQLRKFVPALLEGLPLTLEASGIPALDDRRRRHVVAQLNTLGLTEAEQFVVVDMPRTSGLAGVEAELVNRTLQENTASRGRVIQSSSSVGSQSIFQQSSGSGS